MVSTRGLKYKFAVGERVLCYEPDQTKAKVLYDSKVVEVIDGKDKKGKRSIEYLIHFQGWNSSWDRSVQEDFVLKDTEKNRQLQKDLAEKSQLQINTNKIVTRSSGAYLYRKDRKKPRLSSSTSVGESKPQTRSSTEDNSSCGSITATSAPLEEVEVMETIEQNVEHESEQESYSSSSESAVEDDRIAFQISDYMKQFLEYDYFMVTAHNKLVNLPAKIPVTTILENYVKYSSILSICGPTAETNGPRRRNSAAKIEKRERDFDKIRVSIDLRKEVADGVRIYFDFLLKGYLLYKQELPQAAELLSPEALRNFTYIGTEVQSLEAVLAYKQDSSITVGSTSEQSDIQASTTVPTETPNTEKNPKRRLRSHKNAEEDEMILDLGAVTGTSSNSSESGSTGNQGAQTTQTSSLNLLRQLLPTNIAVPARTRELLQNVLSWQILPPDAPAEPSMIYGAVHLSRLIVKLPEFLNATQMSDEKLKVLVPFLNSFIQFLETHKEWFTEDQYKDNIKEETIEDEAGDIEMNEVSTTAADSS